MMLRKFIVKFNKIIILIFYRAQLKLYQKILKFLFEKKSEFDKIKINTINSMQKKQNSVIIFDIIIIDKINFANNKHCLNVAFSRKMNALIIIANIIDIMN